MSVRVCTITVRDFRHGGLHVGERWMAIETTKVPPAARAALRDFHGRFIRVHQDDIGKLGELGLAFVAGDKPLVDAPKTTSKNATSEPAAAKKTSKNDGGDKADARKD